MWRKHQLNDKFFRLKEAEKFGLASGLKQFQTNTVNRKKKLRISSIIKANRRITADTALRFPILW